MTEQARGRIVLYLLHFDPPYGRISHYLGSTLPHRLGRRLRAHVAGYGSGTVRRAVQAGSRVYVSYVEAVEDRHEEHRRKRAGHFKRRCIHCNFGATVEQPLTILNEPAFNAGWQSYNWGRTA